MPVFPHYYQITDEATKAATVESFNKRLHLGKQGGDRTKKAKQCNKYNIENISEIAVKPKPLAIHKTECRWCRWYSKKRPCIETCKKELTDDALR
jgi:hypothetical protein